MLSNSSFLENIISKINASIYIVNLIPYKIEWISDNNRTFSSTGFTGKEIMANGDQFYNRLMDDPDFKESISGSVQFFLNNPNKDWFGVYRIMNRDGGYRWAYATASVYERNVEGIPSKAIVVALDITEQILTDQSLEIALKENSKNKFKDLINSLTEKEIEIIKLIGAGYSTKEIAAKLYNSVKTIENYSSMIKKKLKIKNIAEIGVFAEKIGLV